jgi:hypothetical protein
MRAGIFFSVPIFSIILVSIISPDSGNLVLSSKYKDMTELQDTSVKKDTRYLYVGAEKCASVCHNNDTMGFQFNSWRNSPHSNAYKILDSKKAVKYATEAGLTESPVDSKVCLKCHITGSDLDQSYFASTYFKEEGVTCEACHKHYYDGKTYILKEADCLTCHNDSQHKVHKFNFEKESTKIVHKRPAKMMQENPSAELPR